MKGQVFRVKYLVFLKGVKSRDFSGLDVYPLASASVVTYPYVNY